MATVHLTIGGVMPQGVPAYARAPDQSQTMASGVSNQVSTITATARHGFCSITPLGSVYVQIGPAPNASTEPRYLIPAGITKDIAICTGDKIAVIDAI